MGWKEARVVEKLLHAFIALFIYDILCCYDEIVGGGILSFVNIFSGRDKIERGVLHISL